MTATINMAGLYLTRVNPERVERRWDITRQLCTGRMGMVAEVWSRGGAALPA